VAGHGQSDIKFEYKSQVGGGRQHKSTRERSNYWDVFLIIQSKL